MELIYENIKKAETGFYWKPEEAEEWILDSGVKEAIVRERGLKKASLIEIASAFDIETTSFTRMEKDENGVEHEKKYAWMYCWMWSINGSVIFGRTWDEFEHVVEVLKRELSLDHRKKAIPVYVHNLGFEMSFLMPRIKVINIFARRKRHPYRILDGSGIEWRDSAVLTAKSLFETAKDIVGHPELVKRLGDLDYEKIRTWRTTLDKTEMGYCISDVTVLSAYIHQCIKESGSITAIPMTCTGYVREFCRDACLNGNWPGCNFTEEERQEHIKEYEKIVRDSKMTEDALEMAMKAANGGFVMANAMVINKILKNVVGYDLTSSYPAVMCSELYPHGQPQIEENISYKWLLSLDRTKYWWMADITYYNLDVKTSEAYLPAAKNKIRGRRLINNTKIWYAEEAEVYVTCHDVDCIHMSYNMKVAKAVVNKVYIYKADYLPEPFVRCILELYERKSKLKGIEEYAIEYMRKKGMVNSSFGMCYQSPINDRVIYDDISNVWDTKKQSMDKAVSNYNNPNKGRFLSYLWGVSVASSARANLWKLIEPTAKKDSDGECDYKYCDTDCVKMTNSESYRGYIDEYNRNIREKINKCLDKYNIPHEKACPKDIKGKEHQLGEYSFDGEYLYFKTLGSKRYAGTTIETVKKGKKKKIYYYNGKPTTARKHVLHITISGVRKEEGARYLMHLAHGNAIKALKIWTFDFEFPAEYEIERNGKKERREGSGKLLPFYVDWETELDVIDYQGNEAHIHEYGGIHLSKIGYDTSLHKDFASFLSGTIQNKYIRHDTY